MRETLVILHVTLVMSLLVVILGSVRVTGAGMVLMMCVEEVMYGASISLIFVIVQMITLIYMLADTLSINIYKNALL